MGFLIDTNLWIAIERGKLSAADMLPSSPKRAEVQIFAFKTYGWQLSPSRETSPCSPPMRRTSRTYLD